MTATASDYFGSMRESYDSLIRRAVPRYDEMIDTLVRHLPERAERILELGCGTGNFTTALARRYPAAALTVVDASEEMLAITGARIGARRATPLQARFEELRAGSFDLIVSSISMHHVADKQALYRALFAMTEPGGTFRWADQTRGASDELHALHWAEWLAWGRGPGHCTEDEIASLLAHAEAHDHYTPLAEHFALLAEAGFAPVDCIWRHNMWVIVTADRPL